MNRKGLKVDFYYCSLSVLHPSTERKRVGLLMKKMLVIISFLSFANFVHAEETKSIALKVGIPGSIMLESAVSDKLSLGLEVAGARFYPESSSYSLMNGGGYTNSRAVGARAVWQPRGVFKKGPYLAGWADYLSFDFESYNSTTSGMSDTRIAGSSSTVAAGIMMGYQYLWEESELMLSFGAGYGLIKGTSFDAQQTTTTYNTNTITSTTQVSNVSASTKTSDVFMFDIYIGFLF